MFQNLVLNYCVHLTYHWSYFSFHVQKYLIILLNFDYVCDINIISLLNIQNFVI